MKASSLLTPVVFLLLLTSALFALPEARRIFFGHLICLL
jgi:hypothetical protein